MLRRSFVRSLFGTFVFAIFGAKLRLSRAASPYEFRHGIASGDPLVDGFIIWTRISGGAGETVRVNWQVASDPAMQAILQNGSSSTDSSRDYTVKVDITGLPTGNKLYYRFVVDGVESPVGAARTLPTGSIESARFAVVSCASYPTGYFHVYREIAARDDIDAVIHLGDYIYEYGLGEYATEDAEDLNRVPDPVTEVTTLADYRRRHAQYKTDPDSQAMHAAHPMIAVWDDHEVANDHWRRGSDNHSRQEGRWSRRREEAIQAYFEWMPIRGEARGKKTRIFREFHYGSLLSLIMLDTRMYGRDEQPKLSTDMSDETIDSVLNNRKRRMLGRKQERWLRKSLESARGTTWQVLGQQVLMSTVKSADLEPLLDLEKPSPLSRELLDYSIAMSKRNSPLLLDTWDGYAAAREDLLADLNLLAENPVVLSGDLHTSIAGNLIPKGEEQPVAVEMLTTSVTSPGFAVYLPERRPNALRDATLEVNRHLQYMETNRSGWLCVSFTPQECTGEWHLIDSVKSREYSSTMDCRLSVAAGKMSDGLYKS